MRRRVVSEKSIETSIIKFLQYRGVFVFKVENGGVYDQKRKTYRFNHNTRMAGIADIIGILHGRPLAIEVKSKTGRLSDAQMRFLQQWANEGGIAFVARSIEDVETILQKYEEKSA